MRVAIYQTVIKDNNILYLKQVTRKGFNHEKSNPMIMQNPDVTPREIEIVKMIAEGLNSKEISFQLFISEHTVHTHRRNIVKKLRVKNVAHLVHYSWKNGLFENEVAPSLKFDTQIR